MELVDVEHLFGNERIVFYFLTEKHELFATWSGFDSQRVQNANRDAADWRPR